ncbi:hypothetical protein RchiOBHm_Chr2g0142091 [Rosa chinensis]|uniref:Uncharacterized protein n=1 Tax=Rosa chinensis TaxID=74649 RepID=A0A2P6RXS5_ROSCH|nr:hypothetical protein RchiOBHm_Chr2g0142091 [Rosa chinensis]
MNDHVFLGDSTKERRLFMNSLSFVDSKHSGPCISLLKTTGTERMRCIPELRL